MKFQAKILTSALAVEVKEIDAAGESEARQMVSGAGGRILEIRPISTTWQIRAARPNFNLGVFNQQLHSLLEAGQTLVDAIDVLGRNDKRAHHRVVYDTLLRSLRQGNQLSDAMQALPSVFPSLYVAMVRSSETTGTIGASIRRFMQYQQQVDEIRSKLTAAATYPAILLGVGSLVISFLMLYVLPRFSEVYDEAGSMRNGSVGFVQWWGAFVRNNELLAWSMVLFALALPVVLILQPATRLALHRRMMASPWIGGRIKVLQLARLYRTLGMLLNSGVNVLAAMRMTRDSLPVVMHQGLERAVRLVSEGRPLSQVMRECGMSTEVAEQLLVAGESSGNLDDMMGRIADFYDQETAIWIDTAGRLIEPVLMLGIGLVVGAIVLLLYSPIFDLANIV
ncbi:type II secretion system F family protein [Pseudoduganella sp. FT55W]|uniref:Type II secretion system F family protein n=1 Tax=Duganella rivi TaxID=2666083 RepID=A0A7X4GRC2_9BURK|nr:type II secretion system F family protein [Duganella rivi]MYM67696.1 type II secretion system F family protein [Duganella rivi]